MWAYAANRTCTGFRDGRPVGGSPTGEAASPLGPVIGQHAGVAVERSLSDPSNAMDCSGLMDIVVRVAR